MKTLRTLLVIAIVIFGFSAESFAQVGVNATATTTSTIITPIAITKNVDLNFGNVAVNGTAGTVDLAATVGAARTPSGGVTLPNVGGTVTAAKFTVTGLGTSTYAITLPGTVTLSDGATHTMDVNGFVSTPSGTGQLTAGSQIIYVGATLNVTGGQAAGVYTNTTDLTVTVNYN